MIKSQKLIDLRQSEDYADFLKKQGWTVERINNTNYFVKKLSIIGSVLKIQRPDKVDFETIKIVENKYRVLQTIIEPDLAFTDSFVSDHKLLLHNGYKLSRSPFLPSKTLHLDLTKSLKFKKETRRAIKKSVFAFGSDEIKGSSGFIKKCISPKEIEIFHKAWKKSVNFNRYIPNLESLLNLNRSFPQSKSLFLASHNNSGSIIGGAIFTISSHDVSNYITYYWQGFTNKEGRTSLSQYSLLYQGILWGKKMGCKTFDFEGIFDDRFPNKSWLGFTHFKKQFGGTEVLYPGCYVKFRLPF